MGGWSQVLNFFSENTNSVFSLGPAMTWLEVINSMVRSRFCLFMTKIPKNTSKIPVVTGSKLRAHLHTTKVRSDTSHCYIVAKGPDGWVELFFFKLVAYLQFQIGLPADN